MKQQMKPVPLKNTTGTLPEDSEKLDTNRREEEENKK